MRAALRLLITVGLLATLLAIVPSGGAAASSRLQQATPTPTRQGAQPANGPPGTTFTLTALGFTPSERLDTWANTPSGKQRDVPTWVFADQNGAASWQWVAPADAEGGTWQLIGRGRESRVLKIVEVQIQAPARTPTPEPQGNTSATPASGGPGTEFTFAADGYRASELVGYWATRPDGEVLPNEIIIRADGAGRAQWNWRAPENAPPGAWLMTGRGEETRVVRRIPFSISPGPAGTPLPADGVNPPVGGPGTVFRFGASGFEFEAKLTYWTVDPNAVSSEEAPRFRADRNGHVEFDWGAPQNAPAGQWEMNVYGLDSRMLKKIPFRITRDGPAPSPTQGVEPYSGTYGDTLTFYATELPKGMLFGFWATDPTGAVVPSGREVRAWDGSVRFTWQIPQTVRKGLWTMTLQTSNGDRSNNRSVIRVIRFEVR